VRHRLGLATRTQISVCKSPFPSAGTAVSLFRAKTVQQRPLLLREVESRYSTGRHLQILWHRVKICPLGGVRGDQQPHFLYWDPSISPKLTELKSWNLVCLYVGIRALGKTLSARWRLRRSATPMFYYGTSSVSPKLIELGN